MSVAMQQKEEEYPMQEKELIYALDIGTRSVIGMLGRQENGRVHILAVEKQPHERRSMLDGQIEDIDQVAATVTQITRRLEADVGRRLTQVCVAAAGRSLRTEHGSSRIELSAPEVIGDEHVQKLTAEAVANAAGILEDGEETAQRMLLVGYTATQLRLDQYPLAKLQGHTGTLLEAEVVATFLPSEVVDSLNAVVRRAGLETASLTLEPIAALNAAIPPQLRLLNLVLVDIGAGTSDIAACRDGSVVGYTMATVAGDEISEALMRAYLIDYDTAERIKTELSADTIVEFQDVVGFDQAVPAEEILEKADPAIGSLVGEIARRVLELNGGPPSALFLAGGGSKLSGLCARVAEALEMDTKRVALAGGHFKTTCFADGIPLDDPEYATPLGIAVSSCLGLISDSSRVFLNDAPARLFRSGQLTLLELLMMNGYSYANLIGRTGKSLSLYVDGKRISYHGSPPTAAHLAVNGVEVQPSRIIYAGDNIEFVPAVDGEDRAMTAGELASLLSVETVYSHGEPLPPDRALRSGDRITTVPPVSRTVSHQPAPEEEESPAQTEPAVPAAPVKPAPEEPAEAIIPQSLCLRLNGNELILPPKQDGTPYYLMDLLEHSGLDFDHLSGPVSLLVNGVESLFQQVISPGDEVEITQAGPKEGEL
ncbi:cell division FtsA domain-containing protein [Anaeromassilibacillus sp. An200]|uniref:cell division FtsA domain-containing protein n=1 Tax=Anaeromassilibacillus sp. An200 TaxID=1965587 RepID=UPI001FA8ECCD|nr:cell division FtsA domain-containing protein [Anaeromassilibacillus sp. An200]